VELTSRILVGTSSWADPGFVEEWYPPGLPARDRLAWYAERFDAVELNSSFYALPARDAVARWVEATPSGFRFDVKLHRLLSRHAAPLDSLPADLRDRARVTARGRVEPDPELESALCDRLLVEVAPLVEGGRLGAFLLQLSPAFAPGSHAIDELAPIVEHLSPHAVAVELRHRAWASPKRLEGTLEALERIHAAFVAVDAPQGRSIMMMPPIDAVTRDDLAYLRAHGRNAEGYVHGRSVAERFGWEYSDVELEEVAGRARGLAEQAQAVHVMFNNNRGSDAPRAAQRFREILGQVPDLHESAT
jgi:uncharacterized protein YecE (DUF72 family)